MLIRLILREEVDNLGERVQVVNVSRGVARNYLLPKRLAMEVRDNNLRLIEKEKKVYERWLAESPWGHLFAKYAAEGAQAPSTAPVPA